jgi:hypothetical protein
MILPSGTIELVVNLKNDEIHIHDPEQPDQFKMFSGAVFSGTYERSFICNAQQHEAILGVHFKAGGAFPFLGAEASELNNAHANLLDLWGRSGVELRERLCTVSTPKDRFSIMDATLESSSRSHQRSTSDTNCAQDDCDDRQAGVSPRRLARAWFLATAIYSDFQCVRWPKSQSLLSNTTISTGACFGGEVWDT